MSDPSTRHCCGAVETLQSDFISVSFFSFQFLHVISCRECCSRRLLLMSFLYVLFPSSYLLWRWVCAVHCARARAYNIDAIPSSCWVRTAIYLFSMKSQCTRLILTPIFLFAVLGIVFGRSFFCLMFCVKSIIALHISQHEEGDPKTIAFITNKITPKQTPIATKHTQK